MKRLVLTLLLASTSIALGQSGPRLSIASAFTEGDTVYTYVQSSSSFVVEATSTFDSIKVSGWARLTEIEPRSSLRRFLVSVERAPEGILPVCVYAKYRGIDTSVCATLVTFVPQMRPRLERRGEIGLKYNPSSEWRATSLPDSLYRTVVMQNGAVVFDRSGSRFSETDLPESMRVFGMTAPLTTTIYWQPEATTDRTRWVPIASLQQ
jgi:hypothetical protein